MGMVMRTGTSYHTMINSAAVAPFSGSVSSSSPGYHYGLSSADAPHLPLVDDLLDFSDHDLIPSHGGANTMATATTNSHYILPAVEPCSVARSLPASGDQMISASLSDFQSQQSSFDLYIPCEEAAELEWLSQFVDDSFSDIPNYQSVGLIPPSGTQGQLGRADQSAVATARGARSKRSRATPGSTSAATWTSSLLTPAAQSSPSSPSSSSSSEFPSFQTKPNGCTTANKNSSSRGKNGSGADHFGMDGGAVRRCTHCASEKTPQWRTGPLGPKTLCNACGVRYKSGRLVPEYRPAASPTFVLTQHSNSHRKVMELRRQKEMLILSNASAASSAAGASRQDLLFSDHHHHYGVC